MRENTPVDNLDHGLAPVWNIQWLLKMPSIKKQLLTENVDLQVSVVLLSSKISLILQSCFTKVQRESTGNSHHSSNGAIDKFG